ncbi:hypothetical protein NDU88_003192 [Pleurodeles waltl]|uniref:Uncharacterized protein n=1 Tax=Pleurodeles waltl TaxID=8319 RepID=A0AAV7KWB0_PLEWA|nr:hypothetical protein NDU88_003192 [Pleurodeles waltl]
MWGGGGEELHPPSINLSPRGMGLRIGFASSASSNKLPRTTTRAGGSERGRNPDRSSCHSPVPPDPRGGPGHTQSPRFVSARRGAQCLVCAASPDSAGSPVFASMARLLFFSLQVSGGGAGRTRCSAASPTACPLCHAAKEDADHRSNQPERLPFCARDAPCGFHSPGSRRPQSADRTPRVPLAAFYAARAPAILCAVRSVRYSLLLEPRALGRGSDASRSLPQPSGVSPLHRGGPTLGAY